MKMLGRGLRGLGFVGLVLSGLMIVIVGYLFFSEGFVPAIVPAATIGLAFAGSVGAVLLGDRLKDD